jgi:SAM-dependent methyltransferase
MKVNATHNFLLNYFFHPIYSLLILIIEGLFILLHPSLYRFYLYFLLEYFIKSPFYYAKKVFNSNQKEFIYGFTPMFTVRKMLKSIPVQGTFYDLGCGDGRVVFTVSILNKIRSRGVELNPYLIQKAKLLKSMLNVDLAEFVEGDFLKENLSKAHIVYLPWTTFDESLEGKITRKCVSELPVNSWVISLSYPINDKAFKLFHESKLFFSWGRSMVYFSQKV